MAAPTITILSATQRTDGSFLVDIDFEVADADADNLNILATEFIENGGSLTAASAQLSDRKHDAVSPLTGITATPKTFRFVWNAFQDLTEGDFNNISFRIEVDDSTTPAEDTLTSIEANTIVPASSTDIRARRVTRRKLVDRSPLDFLGFGLIIPFERGSRDFKAAGGVDLIKSSVRQILLTRGESPISVGELPWRPDFGTALHNLRYQPNDDELADLAFSFIAEALSDFEPRVELREVQVITEDSVFTMRILFDIISENVPGNEVFLDDQTFLVELGL